MAYYPYIKLFHVGCVILSVSLFTFRGALMLADVRWRQHIVLRTAPHLVDTLLLSSALLLSVLLQQYPFVKGWLTAKVIALVIYIVLGSIALKRGRTHAIRAVAFAAALLTVAYIVSVARLKSPLGVFALM
ncbi:regulator SirB [Sinimarinibacterium sp. CAU 1509]|nr:regulator SirB [Sinimarinibacterium sp. CAU 1509]